MPKGSALKALWADPEWRAKRIADLKNNREWIERRAAKLGEGRVKAITRRQTKATRRNADLERQAAIMLHEYQRMLTAYKRISHENEGLRRVFGLPSDNQAQFIRERFGLTLQQAELVYALYRRDRITREQGNVVLFGDRDDFTPKHVDAVLCKARALLKKHGIQIATLWGHGWMMDDSNKAIMRRLLGRMPHNRAKVTPEMRMAAE